MKIFKEFYEWKQAKKSIIQCDTYLANNCDKTLIKISGLDFKQEQILSKIRNMMYSKMKTDLKALVEYEFEF
jgi:hypothetical protein